VIIFSNSTHLHLDAEPGGRADTWNDAEEMIRERYYAFLEEQECTPS
jgi:hypothetical protein